MLNFLNVLVHLSWYQFKMLDITFERVNDELHIFFVFKTMLASDLDFTCNILTVLNVK